MTDSEPEIQSPCIGHCCLDDQDMCVGCFRMLDEILHWRGASPKQQQNILQACNKRKSTNPPRDLS